LTLLSIGLYKIVIFIYKNLNTIKANLQLAVQKRNCKLQKKIFYIYIKCEGSSCC